jgi:hypothetical protein
MMPWSILLDIMASPFKCRELAGGSIKPIGDGSRCKSIPPKESFMSISVGHRLHVLTKVYGGYWHQCPYQSLMVGTGTKQTANDPGLSVASLDDFSSIRCKMRILFAQEFPGWHTTIASKLSLCLYPKCAPTSHDPVSG